MPALERFPDKKMSHAPNIRRHGLLPGFALALAAVFVAGSGLAQEGPERAGYFAVRSAETHLANGVHVLDAGLKLVISSEAREALASGITVTIELQMEVSRVRRCYIDDLTAELTTRYELEYRPLSQRYIVRNLNSGDQDSFATLYSALNNLGRVQGLPVIDDSLLEADKKFRVRLRAMLQTKQYSAPLRLLFFWRDEWQLKSEWSEWILDR